LVDVYGTEKISKEGIQSQPGAPDLQTRAMTLVGEDGFDRFFSTCQPPLRLDPVPGIVASRNTPFTGLLNSA
jgi:hypothetical protein